VITWIMLSAAVGVLASLFYLTRALLAAYRELESQDRRIESLESRLATAAHTDNREVGL